MRVENQIQAIATNTAASAAEALLSSLPPDILQALSPSYLHHLEEELRLELSSLLRSRLQWSHQAIQLELEQQHRHNQAVMPSPLPTPAPADPLPSPDFLQKPSASSELLAELRSGFEPTPAPGAADLPPRKRILTSSSSSSTQGQGASPAPQSPDSSPTFTTPTPTSQAQPPAAAEEAPRPARRRRGREPQPSREEIIKAYNLRPEWLNPSSDPDAKPRRRRRGSAAMA